MLQAALSPPEDPPSASVFAADVAVGVDITGETIGPYRLLEKLGEGGMGIVYLAEQRSPVRRKVALKLIKWGMDTREVLARFETERQALALMDHANIARVLDGGASAKGRPYFAMEYVRGVPITDYCDRHRLGTRKRLQLFVEVCEGVQHAHQKGVIHRDLKSSNVLVEVQNGREVPKIIDFGVAKATALRLTERTLYTRLGQPVGTPEYMSPEQAEMVPLDIDTRTDVYALGVLLYELLVGTRPFDLPAGNVDNYDEIRRRIREEEPSKPSSRVSTLSRELSVDAAHRRRTDPGALRRRLRGDLDWITLKALEKDRTRRYGSAEQLAEDIRRHLSDQPVMAGPPSAAYRLRKFVRRNRAWVGATAVVAVLTVGFAAAMALQANRVAAERDRANAEAEAARQTSDFLVGLFELSNPSEAATVTARELLDQGARRIERELERQPLVRARMMDTIGRVYMELGAYDAAQGLLEEALEVRGRELGESHVEVAESLASLGRLRVHQSRWDEAAELLDRSIDVRESLLGPDHQDTADSMYYRCTVPFWRGQFDAAVACYERLLPVIERAYGPDSRKVAWCLHDLGGAYRRAGRYADSRPYLERALAIKERILGPDHEDVARTLGTLGDTLAELGLLEEARPLQERALEIVEKTRTDLHVGVVAFRINLGLLRAKMGDRAGAEELYVRTVAAEQAEPGVFGYGQLFWLGVVADWIERHEEADRYFRRALVSWDEQVGTETPGTAKVLEEYASILRKMGREAEAAPWEARARAVPVTREP